MQLINNYFFILSLYALPASMYVIFASDGVLAEGEYTHSAPVVQRVCRRKQISCSICIEWISEDVVEVSLS